MCTAISYVGCAGHYFGRNLDLDYCYSEEVTVLPRCFPLHFRCGYTLRQHYAMIGMATISEDYPLFYEATNEQGLSMAGLNFPGNAVYNPKACSMDNIAPFELIPWVLSRCASVKEATHLMHRLNVWRLPFSRRFPLTPLHWLLSDDKESIVIEQMADGLHLYANPFGILTNNPPFPCQLNRLADFMQLQPTPPENKFCLHLQAYSNGMGAIGLPGDYSSASRFVRAAFVKENSVAEQDDVAQFFHMLSSVAMPRGSVITESGRTEITQYSCCCDSIKGIYYYTTYENSRITAVNMRNCQLDNDKLLTYPLRRSTDIHFEN